MENANTENAGIIATGSEEVSVKPDTKQSAVNEVEVNTAGNSDNDDGANATAQTAGKTQVATPMIKNPLPLPTPHTNRKEVDYDYEVPEDQMHFDIEKPSRNYYDIQ